MRLDSRKIVTDHDLLTDVGVNDHHPQVESFALAINSQAISALSAWEWRGPVMQPGHQVLRAILRGYVSVDIQGHEGLFVVAADTPGECSGMGIKAYGPGSGYYTSYMGGYSRLHGDSYLSPDMFGSNVRLRNAYFDIATNEPVLEFFNVATGTRYVTVYGSGLVK